MDLYEYSLCYRHDDGRVVRMSTYKGSDAADRASKHLARVTRNDPLHTREWWVEFRMVTPWQHVDSVEPFVKTHDDLMRAVLAILPNASLGDDNDGQILVYTDLMDDPGDPSRVVPMPESDEEREAAAEEFVRDFVARTVERGETVHLPDPFDPTQPACHRGFNFENNRVVTDPSEAVDVNCPFCGAGA